MGVRVAVRVTAKGHLNPEPLLGECRDLPVSRSHELRNPSPNRVHSRIPRDLKTRT